MTTTAGMTEPERSASARELDLLRQRVDRLDTDGTRGVGAMQVQVAELTRGMAELRAEARTWQEAHDTQHDQETRDRVSGRRWLIGTGIAGFVAMVGMFALLLQIYAQIRGK